MKQISYSELQKWQVEGKDFQLIDVREPEEHSYFNIGGELIPLAQFIRSPERVKTGVPVVVYCKRGIRSQLAIQRLRSRVDADFYNLTSGVYHLMFA